MPARKYGLPLRRRPRTPFSAARPARGGQGMAARVVQAKVRKELDKQLKKLRKGLGSAVISAMNSVNRR
jgi:hypothetical protein